MSKNTKAVLTEKAFMEAVEMMKRQPHKPQRWVFTFTYDEYMYLKNAGVIPMPDNCTVFVIGYRPSMGPL